MKINSGTIQIHKGSEEFSEIENILIKVAKENNIDNVKSVHIALTDIEGTAKFNQDTSIPEKTINQEPSVDSIKPEMPSEVTPTDGDINAKPSLEGDLQGNIGKEEPTKDVKEMSQEEKDAQAETIANEEKQRIEKQVEEAGSAEAFADQVIQSKEDELAALDAEYARKKQEQAPTPVV